MYKEGDYLWQELTQGRVCRYFVKSQEAVAAPNDQSGCGRPKLHLTKDEKEKVVSRYTESAEAYELNPSKGYRVSQFGNPAGAPARTLRSGPV